MIQNSAKNWLASIAVFLAMSALTFLVWRQQVRHQHSLLSQRTEDVCVQAGRRLEVFMESHLRVASIFARRWSTHETRDFSRKRFEEFGSVLVQELPGYYSVGLLPPDLSPGWVVPGDVPISKIVLDPKRRNVLEEALQTDKAVLSAPFESVQGATTAYAVLPLLREKEFLGYLVVDFRAEALINDCFHALIRSKYHFFVRDGEKIMFRSSPEANEKELATAPTHASVKLQVHNRTWRLDMVPRKEKAKAFGWSAALSLPLLGIFMSMGLSWMVLLLLRRIGMFRAARDQQALLSRKVLFAQEEERARISRELHDELGQLLTALRLEMGWLEKHISVTQKDEVGVLGNTVSMVEQATEELRRMCKGLRPPLLDDLGLEPAARLLVQEFQGVANIEVNLDLDLEETKVSITHEVALCAYRILQECLTNVGKHAQAKNVSIKLYATYDKLTLSVVDDGKGFEVTSFGNLQGCGIEGMKERANLVGGEVDIRSMPAQGTSVIFWVALKDQEKGKAT